MYGVRLYQNVPATEPVSSDDLIAAHDYPAWKKNAARLHPAFPGFGPYDRNWGPQEGGFAPGKRLD